MKIIFFDQIQSFTPNIIEHLKKQGHEVMLTDQFNPKFLVGADLCWFEWCDQNIIVASQDKWPVPIICRLHSYEVFTNYPAMVRWDNVDKLIFVSDYVRSFFFSAFNQVSVDHAVIQNGIDLSRWTFAKHRLPKKPKVAIIGDMSAKKGVQLLLEVISQHPEAEFHWAGPIGDPRFATLWNDYIQKIGAQERCFYTGYQKNVNAWLEDKDLVLSCSPWESFGYSIVQSMAKGIKTLIYNFPGAQYMFPPDLLWQTTKELNHKWHDEPYWSEKYRQVVVNNAWTEERQMREIDELIARITKKPEKPAEVELART